MTTLFCIAYELGKTTKALAMQNHPSSPFHQELYQALLHNIENKIDLEGLQELTDISSFKKQLQSELQNHNFSLENIITNYHHFIAGKKAIALEKVLMDAFSKTQSPLKMYRGLPRIYKKQDPTFFKIKPEFSNLKILKYLIAENLVCQEYENKSIDKKSKIALITQVLPDGFGDLIAHNNSLEILREKFPGVEITSILCIPENCSSKYSEYIENSNVIYYRNNCFINDFSKELLTKLKKTSVVITIATKLDCIENLKQIIHEKPQANTQVLCFGEYGFIESKDFGPNSGAYSMGLHFLEKGIFIPSVAKNFNFSSIQNAEIRFQLFGTFSPSSFDTQTYKQNTSLYFGYLSNSIAGCIFLKTIMEKEKKSLKNIDLISPDISWLISLLRSEKDLKQRLFCDVKEFAEMQILFNGKIHSQNLGKGKKILRIICPGVLNFSDFQALMFLSDPFVAVRGNLSISYAIAMNKIYFYDAPKHCKYFLQDLICLANNISSKGNILSKYFHSMARSSHLENEESDQQWVTDSYFQQIPYWETIAKDLSLYLQNPVLNQEFNVLNNRIKKEFNFSKNLYLFVKRAIFHSNSKTLQDFDHKQLHNFAQGHQTIQITLNNIQNYLSNFEKFEYQEISSKSKPKEKKTAKTKRLEESDLKIQKPLRKIKKTKKTEDKI